MYVTDSVYEWLFWKLHFTSQELKYIPIFFTLFALMFGCEKYTKEKQRIEESK